ncbi:MAG TPA: hypothetical protein VMB03_22930 [Bryobacteraceae bacterium]|nr:hypothetical protein [Bryobacteraceae bacterium]
MWVTYFFIGYLILALAIPLGRALVPLWRKANASRCVRCPRDSKSVSVRLDPWYAVKMRALGNCELRVRDCTEWPGRAGCERECLVQIGAIT